MRKLPFGIIGQVGKSFRNEITPGNFIFRTREFEQMELNSSKPGEENRMAKLLENIRKPMAKDLNLSEEATRLRDHDADELSLFKCNY